jgi:hypothetical protein
VKPLVSMRDALADPNLLGGILDGPSWAVWCVLLIASQGERLTDDERVIFERFTGRPCEPGIRVEEFWGIIGRRGGKSRAISVLSVYVAALCDHSENLVSGERGLVLCLAQNQRTAAVTFEYACSIFESKPVLGALIIGRTADTLSLKGRIDLEIRPASFRSLRGLTCVQVIADETAVWFSDETSANTDAEILNAIRPALATTGGQLFVISSPYGKFGEVWETFNAHYGPDGDPLILVAKGSTAEFNPQISPSVIARAMARNPIKAMAEYGAEFRPDASGYADVELIQALVDSGVVVRPPQPNIRYVSFTDVSGGVRDSFTCGVAHLEDGVAVLDCLLEIKAPFNPSDATWQVAETLKSYRLHTTTGDKFSAQYAVSAFAQCGITYTHSERDRSAVYADMLPLLTSGRCRLLDNPRLVAQFAGLRVHPSPGGKDRIDHGRGGHDDVCNAAAGALTFAAANRGAVIIPDSVIRAVQQLGQGHRRGWSFAGPQQSISDAFAGRPGSSWNRGSM